MEVVVRGVGLDVIADHPVRCGAAVPFSGEGDRVIHEVLDDRPGDVDVDEGAERIERDGVDPIGGHSHPRSYSAYA